MGKRPLGPANGGEGGQPTDLGGVNQYGTFSIDLTRKEPVKPSNTPAIHPLPDKIPATKEPKNKTYNPEVMEGVDAPFPFQVPNSVHQILYKRHTIGDGDCLFYAISLIRAFRRGEKINEEGLEGKAEWLKKSLLENLPKFVKDAKERKMVFEYKNEKEIKNILQTPKKWANTDVAALAARFLRNDITIIGREKGNPRYATVFTYRADLGESTIEPYYIFFDGVNHFDALLSTIELPTLRVPP
eukprot:jgi/Mesvir1/12826/Mv20053-RA.1